MADGKGCICGAYSESECGCDADWTPKELYAARDEIARLRAEYAAISGAMMAIRRENLHLRQELADAKKWAMAERGRRFAEDLRLTDDEREAVAWAARLAQSQRDSRDMAGDYAATMRGLLERTGAANSGEDRRGGGGE